MRKSLGLLLSLILVIPVLSGCFPEDSQDYNVSFFQGADKDTIVVEFDYDLSAGPGNSKDMCNPDYEKYESLYGDMTVEECRKKQWEEIFIKNRYVLLSEFDEEIETGVDVSCSLKDLEEFATEEAVCIVELDKDVFPGNTIEFKIKAFVKVGDIGEAPIWTPVLAASKTEMNLPSDPALFEDVYAKFCEESPNSSICTASQLSDDTGDVTPDNPIGGENADDTNADGSGDDWVTTQDDLYIPLGPYLADGGACSLNPNGHMSVFGIFFILFSLIGILTERREQ